MATALIQFTQGANTDSAGKAVLGVHGDFSAVTVVNDDNTGVASWKIYMLDAPPDSAAYPPGDLPAVLAEASDSSPTLDFTPDVAGTYRLMLEVVDGSDQIDRDIRCFGIPDARGFVRPPYQENPPPLPVALPSALSDGPRPVKPDEQNYGDNSRGWAGTAGQLDDFLRRHADLPQQLVDVTPFEASVTDAPVYLVDVPTVGSPVAFTLPESPRSGFVVRVIALGAPNPIQPVNIEAAPGGNIGLDSAIEIVGGASVELVHQGANVWHVLSRSGHVEAPSTAPVTVIAYSGLGVTTEVFPDLTSAVAKNFPSSVPNAALYLIAPDAPAPGPFELDDVVEYTFKSLIGSNGFAGMPAVTFPEMTIQSTVTVEGCTLGGAVSGGGGLNLKESAVFADVTVDVLSARYTKFGPVITTAGACHFEHCGMGSCTIMNISPTDPVVEIYNSTFEPLSTVEFTEAPGVLKMDALSYYSWNQNSGAVTNGTIELVGLPFLLPPQSITGGDPAAAVDSIVDALVALGLATDDRV